MPNRFDCVTDFKEYLKGRSQTVSVRRVSALSHRLDAPAFLGETVLPLRREQGSSRKLSDIAEVFTIYIQSPILAYVPPGPHSRPYLTTSELGEYQHGHPMHVSLVADPRLLDWEIMKGYVLVSRSGRVGETYWADNKLDGSLVGDCFRVVAKNPTDRELIYTFLRSPLGQGYISGSVYGSVVEHASLDQLKGIEVPIVSSDGFSRLTELTQNAFAEREAAYRLLEEAQSLIYEYTDLPQLKEEQADWFDPERKVESTVISSREVAQANGDGSEYRLEAHYHNPLARHAVKNLQRSSCDIKTVKELSDRVILTARFKRNYVESDRGTPFLSGKNIVQMRPTDLKHLSNMTTEDLEESLLKRGWTLITRSGTLGRTCFVWHNYEGYAASEHILRVVPNELAVDPGYLYAFLSSEYGYQHILKFRHGSVIDEVTDRQIAQVLVPVPSPSQQNLIGSKVRAAYEKRAEAIRLEDEAQAVLMKELKEQ